MNKVVSEFAIDNYKVLTLDGEMPKRKYTEYVIDGKRYNIVPVYDLRNCIAVQSADNFIGKTVMFN